MKRIVLLGLLQVLSLNVNAANLLAVEGKNPFKKLFPANSVSNSKYAKLVHAMLPPENLNFFKLKVSKDQILKHYRALVFLGDEHPTKITCKTAKVHYTYAPGYRAPTVPYAMVPAKASCNIVSVGSWDDYKVVSLAVVKKAAAKANAIENTLKPFPIFKFPPKNQNSRNCNARVCF